ncbi:hypothetical protein HHI36_014281 [Cryptolaemus montrouzieri]|uniref:Lipoprotein n=1 Tax=Cryptolaemus montrouzieri TaxID=559131 RepID=A0ABD2N2B2_9CUCU
MKMIILVTIFLLSTCSAKKNIIFEKVELIDVDENYGTARVSANRYNKTSFFMDVEVNLTKNWPQDALLQMQIFKFSDNNYKKSALGYEKLMCEFIKKDKNRFFGSDYMKDKIRLADVCPIKGYFWVKADPNRLLENIINFLPLWRCKAIFSIFNQKTVLFSTGFYFRVEDD